MFKLIIVATAAALLSLATAGPLAERQDHPDQITLGRWAYGKGYQNVAWPPSKTTNKEACRTHATVQSVDSGYPNRPLCGSPFSVGNLQDVTLVCSPNSGGNPTLSDVVAVNDASGTKIENCVSAIGDWMPCDNGGGSLKQEIICTWEAGIH